MNIMDWFRGFQRDFQLTFSRTNPSDQRVLAFLQEFCHANKTTALSNDPIKIARLEGRREVWLYIQRSINLTPEEQFALASKKGLPANE